MEENKFEEDAIENNFEESSMLAEGNSNDNEDASCSTVEKTVEEADALEKAPIDNTASASPNEDREDPAIDLTGSISPYDTSNRKEQSPCENTDLQSGVVTLTNVSEDRSVGVKQDFDTEDGGETAFNTQLELESAVKHISIQKDLSRLVSIQHSDGKKMPCPLCPEHRFRSCHSHKVLKHLENFHWKVSVEFEGYRMCICCLHCLRSRAPSKNEFPGKVGAHYHCIICSAIVSRRPEMIKHIKRHVDKGETNVKLSSGKPHILQESNTEVQVLPNFTTPQLSGTFFNPVMKTNRQLVFCALSALAEERNPLECLDAFSSTGIMGLQWAKHLGSSVRVTVNDISDSSINMIRENCLLNKMKVTMKGKEMSEVGTAVDEDNFLGTIEVTQMDANVLMHMQAFDFIHLDPFGSSVNYLDAAFRNIRNLGILSVTSTDTGSLYAKTVHVTKRHYSCNIIRTEYYKELAARIVLAAIARAAARCNKGIEVLLSVALEHFVLVIVRVLRGPSLADESAKQINSLIHCNWCEERIFQKEGNMVEENPYKQLPCNCHESMPGRSAVMLGPLWSGPLFNTGFLRRMTLSALSLGNINIVNLIKTLISESECTIPKQYSHYQAEEGGVYIKIPSGGEVLADPGKRKRQDVNTAVSKRLKSGDRAEHPPFYYSIHRHAIGGLNIPKLNKILQYLSEAGFIVSRTHFDPTGIRTNAPLATVKAIIEKNSTLSNTPQSSSYRENPETPGEEEQLDAASVSDTP